MRMWIRKRGIGIEWVEEKGWRRRGPQNIDRQKQTNIQPHASTPMHWCINPPWSECIVHSKIHLHTSIPWVPQHESKSVPIHLRDRSHSALDIYCIGSGMAHTSAPLPHPFPDHSDFISKQQNDLSSFFGFPLFKLVDVLFVNMTDHTTNQRIPRRSRSIYEPSQHEKVSFWCSPIVFQCSNGMSIPPTKQHRIDLRFKRCWNGPTPHLPAPFALHPIVVLSTLLILLLIKPFNPPLWSCILRSSSQTCAAPSHTLPLAW